MTFPFAEALDFLNTARTKARDFPENEIAQFFDFCLKNNEKSKSQIFQDLFVLFEMKSYNAGFFVEFGASDGIALSNSYMLEAHFGWTGILAEPARIHKEDIKKNRNCIVDTRCVWSRSGERLLFNETSCAELSTIDMFSSGDVHADARASGVRYEVETISLTDLLDYHRAPRQINYLSIDTEGSELEILSNFDWGSYEIEIITVEHNYNSSRENIFNLLCSKGYRRKFETVSKWDDWYIRNS